MYQIRLPSGIPAPALRHSLPGKRDKGEIPSAGCAGRIPKFNRTGELLIHQHLFNRAFYHGGFPVLTVLFVVRHQHTGGDGSEGEQGNAPEQAGQTDDIRQYGPSTRATAKVTPILMPINAIALVRFCSWVVSDGNAMTAARSPCTLERRQQSLRRWNWLSAATILPAIK